MLSLRFFNTEGTVRLDRHYRLPFRSRGHLEEELNLIGQ